jgi:hypothetical protein
MAYVDPNPRLGVSTTNCATWYLVGLMHVPWTSDTHVAPFKEPFSMIRTICETVLNGQKWSAHYLNAILSIVRLVTPPLKFIQRKLDEIGWNSWMTAGVEKVLNEFIHLHLIRARHALHETFKNCWENSWFPKVHHVGGSIKSDANGLQPKYNWKRALSQKWVDVSLSAFWYLLISLFSSQVIPTLASFL